jgi:hypothetical protein
MPTPAPLVRKQTIKQAKAAYKSKGQPLLSDREQRQLQRAVELERRAWHNKEQEKRKAGALRKRQEKERREKEELAKVQMGTQRRCDRFGYKSSQMHLGAFFGKPRNALAQKENLEQEEETFGDDGVDDESLLEVLESPKGAENTRVVATHPHPHAKSDGGVTNAVMAGNAPTLQRSKTEPSHILAEDLNSFWDELGSSTQIARELDDPLQPSAKVCSASFSSGDFDITAEEIEETMSHKIETKSQTDRKLMPPPILPLKPKSATTTPYRNYKNVTKSIDTRDERPTPSSIVPPPGVAFTTAELESFVDDDLQLTQAIPG